MRFQTDIYGELHTLDDRKRIEGLIMSAHSKNRYSFLLLEELGPHRYTTQKAKEKAINDQMYSIGPLGLELAILLNIPAIGIDLWNKEIHKTDKHGPNGTFTDARRSFLAREKHMYDVINRYHMLGRTAVIVGDTHLRTIRTPELGDISFLRKKFKSDRYVTFHRCPDGEIA